MSVCAHCGLEPLTVDGKQIDACFKGAIAGNFQVSGCCGHGVRDDSYVRLEVTTPAGQREYVDLNGFVVQPYGAFRGQFEPGRYPPLNVDAD